MNLRRIVLVTALTLLPALAGAAPVEGKDYHVIEPAQPTSDPTQVVVTQFFSYQCPHCFAFAKTYEQWAAALPKDVKEERVAVSIGHAGWVAAGRAYYALVALKAAPAIDEAFFNAVHRQRVKLTDEASITDWVARQGVDREAFLKAYRSFSVQLQFKRAEDASRKYRLPSVPAIAVDGKYLVPISDDGDFSDQLAVLDWLIERARREHGAPPAAES